MRVVTYSRVSSDDQAEMYGLDAQRHALLALATRHGHTVIEEVMDGETQARGRVKASVSGTIADRRGLDRVRTLLRSGAAEGVLLLDMSRLARDTVLGLTLMDELFNLGKIEFVGRVPENTPDGKMWNGIECLFAERERSKLIERTMGGRLAKSRRGLVPCGPYPFGYRPEKPARGAPYREVGGLCVVEHEARFIRQLYAWAEDGISIRQMARRLTSQGVKAPRGGSWSKATLTKLLRNTVYKGEYIRGRVTMAPKGQPTWLRVKRPESEWIRIAVTPIVSTVTWERAQTCFERNRSRLVGRPDKRQYLLRGLLVCGLCGKRYVGGASRGTRVYRCSGRDSLLGDRRCLGSRTLAADLVEHAVKAEVMTTLNHPRRLFAGAAHQLMTGTQPTVRQEADEVTRTLRDVRARRERLLDALEDGAIPKAKFAERDGPLASEEARLAKRDAVLAQAVTGSRAQAARVKAVEAQAKLLRAGLARLDFSGWRRLLSPLVEAIWVRPELLEIRYIFSPPADPVEEIPANPHAIIVNSPRTE